MSFSDYNQKIIEEFRTNGGKPPSWTGSSPLVLVHHRGAKSGAERVNPVAYLADGGRYVIFASKAGAPSHPAWYHNLKAHPETQIEVGSDTIDVTVAGGDRRGARPAVRRAGRALAAVRRVPGQDRAHDPGPRPHAPLSQSPGPVADPVARARPEAGGAVGGIGELAALERQTAAPDALGEPGLRRSSSAMRSSMRAVQALERRAQSRPVGARFAGSLASSRADLVERQPDVLGEDDERDAAQDRPREAAMAGADRSEAISPRSS